MGDPKPTAWFCWNSRRWVLAQTPPTCPHLGGGVVDCIGPGCGYFEERPMTDYLVRRLAMLRDVFGDD